MRISLDAGAISPTPSGIGLYVSTLARKLKTADQVAHLSLFVGKRRMQYLDGQLLAMHWPKILAEQYKFYTEKYHSSVPELFHGPNYFLPDRISDGIITVHDLSVLRFPEMHPEERVREFERKFSSSLERSSIIITDTEVIKEEVVARFGLSRDRVCSIHLAAGSVFRPRDDRALSSSLAQWGLRPGQYGLSVCTLEPRKRIRELVEAWGELDAKVRSATPLVLCGADGWRMDVFERTLGLAEKDGWLVRTGYVGADVLPLLYAGARLFVYPSLYEGFGLPPLEAMASGVPVLISDEPSLVEVAGDAACIVDPADAKAFTAAINRLLTDDEMRSAMREKGLAHSATYDWSRCVQQTIDVYHSWYKARKHDG